MSMSSLLSFLVCKVFKMVDAKSHVNANFWITKIVPGTFHSLLW